MGIYSLDLESANIYGLEDAEKWSCRLIFYSTGLSSIFFQLHHVQLGKLYISFLDTRYFDGPVGWDGASFKVAPQEECRKVWGKLVPIERFEAKKQQYLINNFKLFVSQSTYSEVRILSATTHISDVPPNVSLPVLV
jgi:hypothetical protein